MITTFRLMKSDKRRMNMSRYMKSKVCNVLLVASVFLIIIAILIVMTDSDVFGDVLKLGLALSFIMIAICIILTSYRLVNDKNVVRFNEKLWSSGRYLFYQFESVYDAEKTIMPPTFVVIDLDGAEVEHDTSTHALKFTQSTIGRTRGVDVNDLMYGDLVYDDYLQYILTNVVEPVKEFKMYDCWSPSLIDYMKSLNGCNVKVTEAGSL